MRWPSRIFNRNACVYQTATQWDLPPYQITIWLIDWWCNVCLFTWWIDSMFLLQRFDIGNRWIWTRIDYHPCITSKPTNQVTQVFSCDFPKFSNYLFGRTPANSCLWRWMMESSKLELTILIKNSYSPFVLINVTDHKRLLITPLTVNDVLIPPPLLFRFFSFYSW